MMGDTPYSTNGPDPKLRRRAIGSTAWNCQAVSSPPDGVTLEGQVAALCIAGRIEDISGHLAAGGIFRAQAPVQRKGAAPEEATAAWS